MRSTFTWLDYSEHDRRRVCGRWMCCRERWLAPGRDCHPNRPLTAHRRADSALRELVRRTGIHFQMGPTVQAEFASVVESWKKIHLF